MNEGRLRDRIKIYVDKKVNWKLHEIALRKCIIRACYYGIYDCLYKKWKVHIFFSSIKVTLLRY